MFVALDLQVKVRSFQKAVNETVESFSVSYKQQKNYMSYFGSEPEPEPEPRVGDLDSFGSGIHLVGPG
jgi:hypothetical protein